MKKYCKTCLHIKPVVNDNGYLVYLCRISGEVIDSIELEDYDCDSYEQDKSEKPSKEEILEAIRQGVYDAFLIDTSYIAEAIRQGVEEAFKRRT